MNDEQFPIITTEVQPAPKRTRRTKAEMAAARTKSAAEYSQVKKAENESKRDLFVRVANRRVRTAIHAIRIIANMGGQNAKNYEYSQTDVDAIAGTLGREVGALEIRLQNPRQTDIEFDLAKVMVDGAEGDNHDG